MAGDIWPANPLGWQPVWQGPLSSVPFSACPYCGHWHQGMCLRVKSVEYHDNGSVKRVEFHDIFGMAAVEDGTVVSHAV